MDIDHLMINDLDSVNQKFVTFLKLFETFLKTTLAFDTFERCVFNANTSKKFSKHILYRFYKDNREMIFHNNFDNIANIIFLFENDVKNFAKLLPENCTNKEFISNITVKECQLLTAGTGGLSF